MQQPHTYQDKVKEITLTFISINYNVIIPCYIEPMLLDHPVFFKLTFRKPSVLPALLNKPIEISSWSLTGLYCKDIEKLKFSEFEMTKYFLGGENNCFVIQCYDFLIQNFKAVITFEINFISEKYNWSFI